jgi:orotate phosphoribosyltransferase
MLPAWLEYHPTPVPLHSGQTSHWLVRGDLIFLDPHLRSLVLDVWQRCLGLTPPPAPYVLGVPSGGTPWARALAERVNGTYIEPDAPVPEEGEVVVVDDVLTTGHSLESFRPDIPIRTTLVVVDRLTARHRPGGAWARMYLP